VTVPQPGDVTFGEIVRSLQALQEEIRALRGEHVRRDLYEAHRLAMAAEVTRIDERDQRETERLNERFDRQEESRNASRKQVLGALVTAVLSLAVNVIMLFVHR